MGRFAITMGATSISFAILLNLLTPHTNIHKVCLSNMPGIVVVAIATIYNYIFDYDSADHVVAIGTEHGLTH